MRGDLTSPERFEELVREQQGMVFGTLTRMTGAGAHVEDLAQEVFLRLYRALPEFRGDAAISTYLYRIVVNVAQDEWKRRRKERLHIASEPAMEDEGEAGQWIENFAGDELAGQHARTPEQLMEDAQTAQAVDAALLELAPMERAVLVLYHQEELSYEGISAALEMPINTVRTHLHRGRKRLGEMVRERLSVKPHNVEEKCEEETEGVPRRARWANPLSSMKAAMQGGR
jgi:RNA polymerase sigma-70 factor (ECF subfamily)